MVQKTLAVLCASFAVAASGQTEDKPSDRRSSVIMAMHNAERERLDLPQLRWNATLARDAQVWAVHLARQGHIAHSTREQRRNAGENLWMGSKGYFSPEVMIGSFLDEQRHFRRGNFPHVSATGAWQDVGHYTQIIWRDTREVGCAIAEGPRDEILVCRYWPAGNYWGQPVY